MGLVKLPLHTAHGKPDGWMVGMQEGKLQLDGCTTLQESQCHIHRAHLAFSMVALLVQGAAQ